MPNVTSDEALTLLRSVASGQAVPGLKDPARSWDESTMELAVDGWTVTIFTDENRRNHVDLITSPDGRRGEFKNWRSGAEFSQQPEDRLHREDNKAVDRMFQAFRRAQQKITMPPTGLPAAAPITGK
jgi:hypothetical protein